MLPSAVAAPCGSSRCATPTTLSSLWNRRLKLRWSSPRRAGDFWAPWAYTLGRLGKTRSPSERAARRGSAPRGVCASPRGGRIARRCELPGGDSHRALGIKNACRPHRSPSTARLAAWPRRSWADAGGVDPAPHSPPLCPPPRRRPPRPPSERRGRGAHADGSARRDGGLPRVRVRRGSLRGAKEAAAHRAGGAGDVLRCEVDEVALLDSAQAAWARAF
mmetsp:Transcript_30140/g.78114  ORF Transcript_30140/g.78114 Transcript_30140/m.78114 type:complete len:219 (+) Transcript_30140:278-934(+)